MTNKQRAETLLFKINNMNKREDLQEMKERIATSQGHIKAKELFMKALDLKLDIGYNRKALIEDGEFTQTDAEELSSI